MVEIETTLRQWFPRLISGRPHQVIFNNADPTPLMLRWYVLPRNRVANVYVHKFLRSDDDRAFHDRPWWFVSLILRGHYIEHTPDGDNIRTAGTVAVRSGTARHWVELPTAQPVWTFIGQIYRRTTGETRWTSRQGH